MVNIKLEEPTLQSRSSQLIMSAKNNIAAIKQEEASSMLNSAKFSFSKLPAPPILPIGESLKQLIKIESPELVIMTSPEPSPIKSGAHSNNKESNLENFQAELTCQICFNPYDENDHVPINLYPCGHTFCQSCLKQIKQHCPSCKSNYTLTTINYALKNMTIKYGPFKYVPKIKELLNKDLVKKFSATNDSVFKAQKLFVKNFLSKMNDKIEEINQRNDKNKKAISREIIHLEKYLNSNYQNNVKLCSELNKKISAWSNKIKINDEKELKNIYEKMTEEFNLLNVKHQYIEKKDINNINLVNLNLTEDFVEELSHQVMQFCDENTIEIKFKNLSLKHDNPIMPIEQLENVDSKRNMEKSGITSSTIQFIIMDIEFIKRLLNRFYYGLKSQKYKDKELSSTRLDPINVKTIVAINQCKSYLSRVYSNLNEFKDLNVSEMKGDKLLMDIFKTSIDLYIKFNNMYHCKSAKELSNLIGQVKNQIRHMTDNTDIFRVKNTNTHKELPQFDFNRGLKI